MRVVEALEYTIKCNCGRRYAYSTIEYDCGNRHFLCAYCHLQLEMKNEETITPNITKISELEIHTEESGPLQITE